MYEDQNEHKRQPKVKLLQEYRCFLSFHFKFLIPPEIMRL